MVLSFSAAQAADTAKNVILMISDGWGYNQIRATDYFNGTLAPYEDPVNSFARYAMSTYSMGPVNLLNPPTQPVDYDPTRAWTDFGYLKSTYTDSASAATAMATGIKNYDNQINWYYDTQTAMTGKTITEIAATMGKSAGVVTSVEWSHATPAGFYAHNANRSNYAAIANEMLGNNGTNSPLSVIMGAGNPGYNNNGTTPASNNYNYVGGSTTWTTLNNGALNNGNSGKTWTPIQSQTDFANLASTNSPPDMVVGTAQVYETLQAYRAPYPTVPKDTLPYADTLNSTVPDLATMSEGALNVLSQNSKGFFLMIEGGAVDWANHANLEGRLIEEMNDFNKSVDAAISWIETKGGGWDKNLLIVTGDHECGLLLGPQADPNNPVWNQVVNLGPGNLPMATYNSGSHTNSLIPLFAKGAGSDLFAGYANEHDPGLLLYQGLSDDSYIDNTEVFLVMNAQISAAPIPGSVMLLGTGVMGIIIGLRRKNA